MSTSSIDAGGTSEEGSKDDAGDGKVSRSLFFSEAMLIAVAPVAAYVLVFCYDAGYLTTLGIPIDFISIQPTTILTLGAILFVYLAPVVVYAQVSRSMAKRKFKKQARRLKIGLIVNFLLCFIAIEYWIAGSGVLAATMFAIGGGLSPTLISLGAFVASLRSAKEAHPTFFNASRKRRFTMWFLRSGKTDYLFRRYLAFTAVVFLITLGVFISTAMGVLSVFKGDWPVISGTPPRLVVAKYGDDVLTIDFDPKTRTIGNRIKVFRADDNLPEITMSRLNYLRFVPGIWRQIDGFSAQMSTIDPTPNINDKPKKSKHHHSR